MQCRLSCLSGVVLLGLVVAVSRAARSTPAGVVSAKQDATEESTSTPLGDITVRTFGPTDGKLVIAIHGQSPTLVYEWEHVAAALASKGYRVLLPNLHSNPSTSPSGLSTEQFSQLALSLAGGGTATWMGKSWGGANVAAATALRQRIQQRRGDHERERDGSDQVASSRK